MAGDNRTAESYDEFTVAVGPDPAQRPGVPTALEAFILGDQLQGEASGLAADVITVSDATSDRTASISPTSKACCSSLNIIEFSKGTDE